MYQTINEYDFTRAFQESDSHKNQFSYGALKAIFAYYEEYEESTGEEIELDIVATCCEFAEYDNALECAREYSYIPELNSHLSDDDIEKQAREWLEDRTMVLDAINVSSGLKEIPSIVILNF